MLKVLIMNNVGRGTTQLVWDSIYKKTKMVNTKNGVLKP